MKTQFLFPLGRPPHTEWSILSSARSLATGRTSISSPIRAVVLLRIFFYWKSFISPLKRVHLSKSLTFAPAPIEIQTKFEQGVENRTNSKYSKFQSIINCFVTYSHPQDFSFGPCLGSFAQQPVKLALALAFVDPVIPNFNTYIPPTF